MNTESYIRNVYVFILQFCGAEYWRNFIFIKLLLIRAEPEILRLSGDAQQALQTLDSIKSKMKSVFPARLEEFMRVLPHWRNYIINTNRRVGKYTHLSILVWVRVHGMIPPLISLRHGREMQRDAFRIHETGPQHCLVICWASRVMAFGPQAVIWSPPTIISRLRPCRW